jgi:hypothetical protein
MKRVVKRFAIVGFVFLALILLLVVFVLYLLGKETSLSYLRDTQCIPDTGGIERHILPKGHIL